jgi:UPF0716 protein FxsA
MRLFLLIILIFPFAEFFLLALLASHIGGLALLAYLLGSAFLGSWMLRHQSLGVMFTLGSLTRQREATSIYSMLWPLRYSLAGILFIIPGILSEIAGIALLLPLKGPKFNTGRASTSAATQQDDIIEGEFQRVPEPSESLTRQADQGATPRKPD